MTGNADRIEKAWNRIADWTKSKITDADFKLGDGATAMDFAGLDEGLGRQAPEDLKAFLSVHNGDKCQFHAYVEFLKTEYIVCEVTELRKQTKDWDIEPEAAGPVRCAVWDDGWVPFALIGGASEYHCLDMNPADSGALGQVIFVSMKDTERRVLAPSLAEYLERFASTLEAGRLTWFGGAVARKGDEDGDFWTSGDYVDYPLTRPPKTSDDVRKAVTDLQAGVDGLRRQAIIFVVACFVTSGVAGVCMLLGRAVVAAGLEVNHRLLVGKPFIRLVVGLRGKGAGVRQDELDAVGGGALRRDRHFGSGYPQRGRATLPPRAVA